jgi:hypothetical protein
MDALLRAALGTCANLLSRACNKKVQHGELDPGEGKRIQLADMRNYGGPVAHLRARRHARFTADRESTRRHSEGAHATLRRVNPHVAAPAAISPGFARTAHTDLAPPPKAGAYHARLGSGPLPIPPRFGAPTGPVGRFWRARSFPIQSQPGRASPLALVLTHDLRQFQRVARSLVKLLA